MHLGFSVERKYLKGRDLLHAQSLCRKPGRTRSLLSYWVSRQSTEEMAEEKDGCAGNKMWFSLPMHFLPSYLLPLGSLLLKQVPVIRNKRGIHGEGWEVPEDLTLLFWKGPHSHTLHSQVTHTCSLSGITKGTGPWWWFQPWLLLLITLLPNVSFTYYLGTWKSKD
jgi:hypothetical protein